jgi:3-oxoacyl-[acyl-carrier protein] reductase
LIVESGLKDQVVLVTGASRGIGRAVAREMGAAGAIVVVNYRDNQAAAQAVLDEIVAGGGRAISVQADVSQEEDVKRLVKTVLTTYDRLDVLICNAGIVKDQLAALMKTKDWDAVVETNLRGPFLCVREALPTMLRARQGSVVMISSVAAARGGRGHVNYAASKGGIDAMVRALAVELAPRKIRVNGVAPGLIVTDMSSRVRDLASKEILANIPFGRFGEPEEVARAVRFLASPEASYITGQILYVTGGLGV